MGYRLVFLWLCLTAPALADGAFVIVFGLLGLPVVPLFCLGLASSIRDRKLDWATQLATAVSALAGYWLGFYLFGEAAGDHRYGHLYLLLIYAMGIAAGFAPGLLARLYSRPGEVSEERHFAPLEEVAPMSNPRDFEPILDHIHVQVRDLEASRPFYRAVVEALGLTDEWEDAEDHVKFREFYLDQTDGQVTQAHFAFRATSQDQVRDFHRLALEAGGKDNGEPGYRKYHDQYYGAFVIDPDGNNIEVVYNGDLIPREA